MSSLDDFGGALFQIAEPTHKLSARRQRAAIGIDLGTTHSVVATAMHGSPARSLIAQDGHGALVASVVDYTVDPPRVGTAARESLALDASRVVSSVKRFMGRGVDDISFAHPYALVAPEGGVGSLRLRVGARDVTPTEVSAAVLATLRDRARLAEPGEFAVDAGDPIPAVITVPAYFDDAQRQATRDAGRIAGLEVLRLLAEPTAAAIAYGLDRAPQGLFAVYDLGGGTFDLSVLRLEQGVFRVLATGGDTALGGDDFDRAVAQLLLQAPGLLSHVADDPNARAQLQLVARALKERLSDADEAEHVDVSLSAEPLRLTRDALEQAITPLVSRTIQVTRRVLKDAGLRADELDAVVLVGGSTRVPLVRARVEALFGRPALCELDPDHVVAWGAAIVADVLAGNARDGVALLDVAPLSLGIETMGGVVEKLIPRNASIPIAARQVFTNYSEQQTAMLFHVVQGERELAADCRSLARFELRGIPRLPPSMARVEVTFQLDADALLTVTAREQTTGAKQTVVVKPTWGLSSEEVDTLVMQSLDLAEADFCARDLAEARVEADRVAVAIRAALQQVAASSDLLPADERARIEQALGEVEDALHAVAGLPSAANAAAAEQITRHAKSLVGAREHLERVSEPFAQRRMERALQAGLSGHSLREVEQAVGDEDELAPRRAGHDAQQIDPDAD